MPATAFNEAANANVRFDAKFDPTPVILMAAFGALAKQLRSYKKPLETAIRDVMVPSIKKNFDMEGRPRWVPLSQSTLDTKIAHGERFTRILQSSGALLRSATQTNIWKIDARAGEAYIPDLPDDVWYGRVHQLGAKRGLSPTPERPFLVIQPEDANKIEKVFEDWIKTRLRATGFGLTGIEL